MQPTNRIPLPPFAPNAQIHANGRRFLVGLRPRLSGSAVRSSSTAHILVYSLLTSFSVLIVSFVLQWMVYRDWLRQTGPLHVIGTTIAAMVTFVFVYKWQSTTRERYEEALRRFQTIAEMNDRIRNALQAIECISFVNNNDATDAVRESMQNIDVALRGILAETRPISSPAEKTSSRAAGRPA
jgi:ABC-type multidrug transport system fused ATPase/permease subunit